MPEWSQLSVTNNIAILSVYSKQYRSASLLHRLLAFNRQRRISVWFSSILLLQKPVTRSGMFQLITRLTSDGWWRRRVRWPVEQQVLISTCSTCSNGCCSGRKSVAHGWIVRGNVRHYSCSISWCCSWHSLVSCWSLLTFATSCFKC